MLSKHPLELPIGRKLTKEEVVDALRLAIIAELDAINLYLQIARSVEDENVKRVFEDIAKEEKTHVGEFLALLKRFDTEQVSELRKGEEEVVKLTGIPTPQSNSSESTSQERSEEEFITQVAGKFKDVLNRSRIVLAKLPRVHIGRGVEGIPYSIVGEDKRALIELREIQVKFRVSQRALDYYKKFGFFEAPETGFSARQLATSEEKFVLNALLSCERAKHVKMGTWDTPGQSVADVFLALAEMYKTGVRKPIVLILPSPRYVRLVSVSDRTGVLDLERIKALVDDIIVSDLLPENVAILLANRDDVVDVVFGGDGEVDYIGPEDGHHVFRAWSSIAVRIKDPSGLVVLKSE